MATTKLKAVNTLLSVIGESPVNSLTPPLTGDVSLAETIIDEISTEVQTEGWSWNTRLYDAIPLDASGHSSLASSTLAVRFNPLSYPSQRFVLRGTKLYDRVKSTYDLRTSLSVAMTGSTSDLIAQVVEELDWDSIPESGRRYIMIRAARIYANRIVTSSSIEAYTAEDEERALQNLKRTEDMAQNHNFISGPNDMYGGRVTTTFGPDILNR
jgi:hypothetical protein|tara:strand:+ start:5050 stop:5685 length:636 start_codon:yes stop_codon:yes gene_type:complete